MVAQEIFFFPPPQIHCSLSHVSKAETPGLCFVIHWSAAFNTIPCRLSLELSYWHILKYLLFILFNIGIFLCMFVWNCSARYCIYISSETQFDCRAKKIPACHLLCTWICPTRVTFQSMGIKSRRNAAPHPPRFHLLCRRVASRIFNLILGCSQAHLPHSSSFSQKYPNFKCSLRSHSQSGVHTDNAQQLRGSGVR